MDFDCSTQCRSWLFDKKSLQACREKAVSTPHDPTVRVRKFASGFHFDVQQYGKQENTHRFISAYEQETLLHFHAHQIQSLVGPTAVLPELRKSTTVLATAITYFRRFYLSNCVIEIHPRKIAVACAFLAAKVEEQRVEVSLQGGSWFLVFESFKRQILVRIYQKFEPLRAKNAVISSYMSIVSKINFTGTNMLACGCLFGIPQKK